MIAYGQDFNIREDTLLKDLPGTDCLWDLILETCIQAAQDNANASNTNDPAAPVLDSVECAARSVLNEFVGLYAAQQAAKTVRLLASQEASNATPPPTTATPTAKAVRAA